MHGASFEGCFLLFGGGGMKLNMMGFAKCLFCLMFHIVAYVLRAFDCFFFGSCCTVHFVLSNSSCSVLCFL